MTVRVRLPLALTALVAAAAPAAVAVLMSGSPAAVDLATTTEPPAAASTSYAAEVVSAPQPVALAAPRTAARRVVAHSVTAPAAARRTVRVVSSTAVPAVRRTTVTAPTTAKPATTTASPSRTGDDYPYATATTSDNDPWGFTKRQCVSFVAFRLSQHGHALDNATQGWGSARSWDDAAAPNGVTVSSSPKVGAVAQWNAGESSALYSSTGAPKGSFTAGSYGHVGYVAAVYGDGTVLVEQYNLGGDRAYSALRMKAPRYLVF